MAEEAACRKEVVVEGVVVAGQVHLGLLSEWDDIDGEE